MLKAKFAANEAFSHPLPPRSTQDADTVIPQLLCKNGTFNRMRAVKQPEDAGLKPHCGFCGSG